MTTVLQNGTPAAIDATPGDEVPRTTPFVELGAGGLRRNSGYIDDEFLPALRGRRGVKIYREMSDNSPVIGGWFNAVCELLRQLEWRVEAPATSAKGKKAAKHIEECMHDMEHAWGDMIIEIASFLIYGWELSEINYKLRRGPKTKGRDNSKYSDGLIGWRSINGRAQESILRWVFGNGGEILGAVQQAPPRYERRVLPIEKCLLFRTTIAKNNPEGRSLLRNAYEPWYYLKRHQEIEAVGVARDLAGMPTAKVPSKILQAAPGTTDYAMLEAIKRLVTSVSRNEQEGIVWPQDIDPDTKQPNYVFELLNSGGSRQFDTESIINRYKTEMLQSVVSDWLQVGHEENGGAYNMHVDKTGLFRSLINGFAARIADVFNRQAIPRLFALMHWDLDDLPTIVPNNVDPPDLTVLGGFLQQTAALGVQWFPDPELEKFMRDAAGLPQLSKKAEDILEAQHKQAQIMALANQRLQAVQLDQQVQQGQMGLQQQAMGVEQQQQQLAAGPQDPNAQGPGGKPVDPNDGKRSDIAVATDKVKLSQEKAKLQNLRRPPAKTAARTAAGSRSAGRKPVKKAYIRRVSVKELA